jgi:hypothetical protein
MKELFNETALVELKGLIAFQNMSTSNALALALVDYKRCIGSALANDPKVHLSKY